MKRIVGAICYGKVNLLGLGTGETAVLVAIGANLPRGDRAPLVACRAAVEALRGLAGLRLAGVSRWYETAPIVAHSGVGGPLYVNGVAWLEGAVDPAWLLERLQAIEQRGGRVRSWPDAPRTLDLDILAMGGRVRSAPDPILPHPRLHERRFVLQPLCDVRPEWVHPVLGQSARSLLDGLPDQGVRLLL